MDRKSLQDQYAPNQICFGCGPANKKGLRIKSFPQGEEVLAHFRAESHHQAFEGMISGGIIGTILDCHCNWSAAYFLMKGEGKDTPPCTVTAEYKISLRRPTPFDADLELRSKLVRIEGNKAWVEATLSAEGKTCATCEGLFVAVKPGHLAYHRW